MFGGVLADPLLAGVHHRGELGGEPLAFRVGEDRDLLGPWPGRERDEGAVPVADPGVDDGGDVAGVGRAPLADRSEDDLAGVQACELGGAQGPPQPPGLMAGLAWASGRRMLEPGQPYSSATPCRKNSSSTGCMADICLVTSSPK